MKSLSACSLKYFKEDHCCVEEIERRKCWWFYILKEIKLSPRLVDYFVPNAEYIDDSFL
jgi:hypothetical protein